MSVDPTYLLDANVFIEAKRHYYAFDLCPAFWKHLIQQYQAGRVYSIDRVRRELKSMKDDLSRWVDNAMPAGCFVSTAEPDVVHWYSQMVTWVQAQAQFLPAAKAEFATSTDAWLIAYAKAHGWVVVTHEEHAPDARKKVPIPNVCKQFGVPYVNTFEMLRKLGIKFT